MKYSSLFFVFFAYIASPRFCVNCKHFIEHPVDNEFGRCKLFPIQEKNTFIVTSVAKTEPVRYNYCSTARSFGHMCGERGNLYFPMHFDAEIIA